MLSYTLYPLAVSYNTTDLHTTTLHHLIISQHSPLFVRKAVIIIIITYRAAHLISMVHHETSDRWTDMVAHDARYFCIDLCRFYFSSKLYIHDV